MSCEHDTFAQERARGPHAWRPRHTARTMGDTMGDDSVARRFMFYSHDTFGLGHIRRTLAIASHIAATVPNSEALIVTGSPLADTFTMPPHVDFIKLPAVTKHADGSYGARTLRLDFDSIRELRARLLREAAHVYAPDVFLVDHAPLGLRGEALPALRMLRATRPQCLRVLGLRDIVDSATKVRCAWTQEGVYAALEQLYDQILVYGCEQIYDVATQYALQPAIRQRLHYCGYLDRVPPEYVHPSEQMRGRLRTARRAWAADDQRLVVVTAGGGGDGFTLLRSYAQSLQSRAPDVASVLLTGPLMSEVEVRTLRELAAALPTPSVRVEVFLPDPLPLLASADLVVSMAGYNTVCEVLALERRSLLVPRTTPREEQLVRARLLRERGLADLLNPDDLAPESMAAAVERALARLRPSRLAQSLAGFRWGGQHAAARALEAAWRTSRFPSYADPRAMAPVS